MRDVTYMKVCVTFVKENVTSDQVCETLKTDLTKKTL